MSRLRLDQIIQDDDGQALQQSEGIGSKDLAVLSFNL